MTNQCVLTGLTPELQNIITLESIFTPHTRRQRDDAYNKLQLSEAGEEQLRFAHYTSADAALKIIKTKRLWMRNTTCMSDYREVQHGFDILDKFFSEKTKIDSFVAALDVCAPGVALEAMNLFGQIWHDIRFNTYISSISEHDKKEDLHGRLSMWRAFGGNTARVAIIFKVPKFSEGARKLNLLFSPVAYLTVEEAHDVIHEVIRNIEMNCDFLRSIDRQSIVNQVLSMLLVNVTCLKHKGFLEEKEWRAIYSPKRWPSPLVEASTEVIGGIPQPVYKLPLDERVDSALADLELSRIFERIIIGPSPYSWAMYEAFTAELSMAGVPEAGSRVFVSEIPIRA